MTGGKVLCYHYISGVAATMQFLAVHVLASWLLFTGPSCSELVVSLYALRPKAAHSEHYWVLCVLSQHMAALNCPAK